MILDPPIDVLAHVEAIDAAISSLASLSSRTTAPAPLSHQHIGTILDNTALLLTSPANALDNGGRSFKFTHSRNWLSLMQAVHRSFFSSLHIATEAAIIEICRNAEISVHSNIESQIQRELAILQAALKENPSGLGALEKLAKRVRPAKPVFEDYLESALRHSAMEKDAKKIWRNYFKALSIIRNKSSHADSTLNEREREALRTGGLDLMISASGELASNPGLYAQFAQFTLNFFDSLHSTPPQN